MFLKKFCFFLVGIPITKQDNEDVVQKMLFIHGINFLLSCLAIGVPAQERK